LAIALIVIGAGVLALEILRGAAWLIDQALGVQP
jgi:hypothetical protein